MSKYTMELDELITRNYSLGLTTYPIFDEAYRERLNNKIKDHYRFREIGFETPARFVFYLNRTMNEIMPYFNQLYESAKITFNPLYTIDVTIVDDKDTSGTTHSTFENEIITHDGGSVDTTTHNEGTSDLDGTGLANEDNTDSKLSKNLDTPQGVVTNLDNYLTTASKADTTVDNNRTTETHENGATTNDGTVGVISSNDGTNNGSGSNHVESSATNNATRTMQGRQNAFPADLIKQYRDTFLNIDMMVIEQLHDLFMGIY